MKSLQLNKQTIANLDRLQMMRAFGGGIDTDTCPQNMTQNGCGPALALQTLDCSENRDNGCSGNTTGDEGITPNKLPNTTYDPLGADTGSPSFSA